MKRIELMTTTLLAVGALCAQTPAERQKAVKYLDQTRDGVVAATKGLSDAQMKFKAGPDRWSVAETLEHIAKAEAYLFQNTAENVMKAPGPPAGRDTAKVDAFVLAAIPDRSHKAQAPEPLVPSSGSTPAQSLEQFLQGRAKTVAFVESTQGLRDHAIDSPLGQPLDAYEWVLFIAAHSERHTKQILEVKADPGFPKK